MNYATFNQLLPRVTAWPMHTISPAPDTTTLLSEIESLRDRIILHTYPYIVICCDLQDRPALRQELGRQREITFRHAGESTGLPIDIDAFDEYYLQLIIWDSTERCLVGGYRMGCGDDIFSRFGKTGFYINSFFKIDPAFDEYLPSCLELGRSFIVKAYQRKHLPLYLLWKGIMAFLLQNPQYRFLIGPVSISRFYSDASRKMMMEYAQDHLMHPHFTPWFIPRIPFDPDLSLYDEENSVEYDKNKAFDNMLEDIRPGHIELPVLMKHYISQNAKFLAFNLDSGFNNALDGLMILDIADIPSLTFDMLKREI